MERDTGFVSMINHTEKSDEMSKRYHVILNNKHSNRKCFGQYDNKWDAITACQNFAISSPTETYTVIDMQPENYKYDIFYAEYMYNLFISCDGEVWDRIAHNDLS